MHWPSVPHSGQGLHSQPQGRYIQYHVSPITRLRAFSPQGGRRTPHPTCPRQRPFGPPLLQRHYRWKSLSMPGPPRTPERYPSHHLSSRLRAPRPALRPHSLRALPHLSQPGTPHTHTGRRHLLPRPAPTLQARWLLPCGRRKKKKKKGTKTATFLSERYLSLEILKTYRIFSNSFWRGIILEEALFDSAISEIFRLGP